MWIIYACMAVLAYGQPTITTTVTATATNTTISTATETSFAFASQLQGSLVLNVSNVSIFTQDVFLTEFRAALVAAISDLAGVDISLVIVALTESRRLQSDTTKFDIVTVTYNITVSANEATAVVKRIISTDLLLATRVVAHHLRNAGFDGVVEAVNLSANIVGEDAGASDGVSKLTMFAVVVGAIAGVVTVLVVALCCYSLYRCWICGSGRGSPESKPDEAKLEEMEEGTRTMNESEKALRAMIAA